MRRILAGAAAILVLTPLAACSEASSMPNAACMRASTVAAELSANVSQTRMLEDPGGAREELLSAAGQLEADFPTLSERITLLAERLPDDPLSVTEAEAASLEAAQSDFMRAAREFDQECGIS